VDMKPGQEPLDTEHPPQHRDVPGSSPRGLCWGTTSSDTFLGKHHGESCFHCSWARNPGQPGSITVMLAQPRLSAERGWARDAHRFWGLGKRILMDEGFLRANGQAPSRRPEPTAQRATCTASASAVASWGGKGDISKASSGEKAVGSAGGEGSPWQPAMRASRRRAKIRQREGLFLISCS